MTKHIEVEKLVRTHLRNLKPYSSARDEYYGKVGVFLDANENSIGSVVDGDFNRYPDPGQRDLKEELAKIKGLEPNQIFIGNGSDEAIDLLFRIFCEPNREHVMIMPPTYGMYKVAADINNVNTVPVPLTDDYQLDTEEVISSLRPGTKLVFICSPNNPTGNLMKQSSIEQILKHAPGLVVVDEAYIDFAPGQGLIPLLEAYQNLVILQTFSKAWGMANLRIGMAFAHPEIIEWFNKVKPPYNVNGISQELALAAAKKLDRKAEMETAILEQRAWLKSELSKLTTVEKIYPSHTNFLLAKFPNPNQLYNQLVEEGIIVRNRSKVTLCEGCLRITVGTKEENETLLEALKNLSNQ
ncbi:MAG: histidinol-phosphate transaminase [Bacteroidia bacterium]|nr:histidinol-phosphate transaminase [Bacteroidia bacterium]